MSLTLPQGWPISLWFLIAAVIVVVLQRIPYTGIILMFALAMFWSVLLINAAMIGVAWEALTGRVGKAWLILPALYFGGYYLAYGWERLAVQRITSELAAFNADKHLPFDAGARDLVFEKGKGDMHVSLAPLLETHALARYFEDDRMHFIGSSEACKLAREELAKTSGIQTSWLSSSRGRGLRGLSAKPKPAGGLCTITAPGRPERPVVRITSDLTGERRQLVPLQIMDRPRRDEPSGEPRQVRAINASLLSPFPMPVIGYALNSGAPSWEGFAGFMRSRSQPLPAFGANQPAPGPLDILARTLALEPSANPAARAVGAETVAALTQAADKALTDKELGILEAMLADPLVHHKNSWFYHLPQRPAVVAPYAGRIFAALGRLQASDRQESETGRNLWRLAAVLPDADFAPHRPQLVEWLDPANARNWTSRTGAIYVRLDATQSAERAILLNRLETKRGDLETGLLAGFCEMGSAAPKEVKLRLLAIWQARAPDPAKPKAERGQDDVQLYFTLARLGLKHEAGQVVQRYYGPTFASIWSDVDADTHKELCDATLNDLTNHFRQQRAKGAT